jgi:protein O-GlcNAc transferase
VKSLQAVAVLGGLCVTATAAGQAQTSTQADFARGQALVLAKKPGEAAEKFEAVTRAEPDFAPGWYALAAARRRADQCDAAIIAYRHYARMLPDEPEPYYGLGLCLREAGQAASAVEALKRYVELEKRPASQRWVEHARGVIAELGTMLDASKADLVESPAKPAEAPAPTKPTPEGAAGESPAAPLYARSQALRDSGHIEESIAKFKEAIAADPAHMVSRAALGELLLKVRRDEEAIAVFRAATHQNPDYALNWYELGFALRIRGRMGEAVTAYERYIKLRPTDPDPYYGLARALQKLGKPAEAKHAYETYVVMEKRPSERKWIDAAQAEIQLLSGR